MQFNVHQLVAAGASLAGAAFTLVARARIAKDRQRIRVELESRRCRLVEAQWSARRWRVPRSRGYHVEFVDPDGDPGQTVCTVSRAGVAWGEDFAFADPGPAPTISAVGLPEYGQNWRG